MCIENVRERYVISQSRMDTISTFRITIEAKKELLKEKY